MQIFNAEVASFFLVILNFKYFNPLSSDKGFLHFHENVSKTYLNLNFLPLFVSKTHFTSFYFTYILKFNSVTNIFACKQFKLFWGNEELRESQHRRLKYFVNLTLNFFKFLLETIYKNMSTSDAYF